MKAERLYRKLRPDALVSVQQIMHEKATFCKSSDRTGTVGFPIQIHLMLRFLIQICNCTDKLTISNNCKNLRVELL